jgi:ParB family chromosome partitioning protein
MARKSGLGRGFDELLGDNTSADSTPVEVRLSDIEPNRDQPRKVFDEAALEELSENIKTYGLLQPILVRPLPVRGYQIVAGERRWRACREAGLTKVPVIIKELTDKEVMEIALIENLQREDLNPIEEAEGYKRLIETFGQTQQEVAKQVGKSRSAVANTLRLLELGPYCDLLRDGKITSGHGRALLAIEDVGLRKMAADMAVAGASVRQIEEFAKKAKKSAEPEKKAALKSAKLRDPFYDEVELAMKEELGRKVKVHEGKNKGTLEIEFYGIEDLSDIIEQMFGTKL